MESRTFTILARNKAKVEGEMASLNRRALKMGLEPIELAFGRAFTEIRTISSNLEWADCIAQVDREVLCLPVVITGPLSVSFDGWRFIATLQHTSAGDTIVRSVGGTPVPSRFKHAGCSCEHCGVNRYRTNTYVLANESGEHKQVGSTCIRSFLGGNCPEDILSRADFLSEVVKTMNSSDEEFAGEVSPVHGLVAFLAQAIVTIRNHGWVSKGKADELCQEATAFTVEREFGKSVLSNADREQAQLIASWAEKLSDASCEASDYIHNIRAIARTGMVEYRTAGFAASMVVAYNKAQAELSKVESQFVGEVKEKRVFSLTFTKSFSFCTQYGVQHMNMFADLSGNVFVWETATSSNFEEGKTYSLQGTIKEHSVFRDVKQTILTRCKVVGG